MTRGEHRAKCIEAAAKAHYEAKRHINVKYPLVTWGELGPISKSYKLKLMTAAFDAIQTADARVLSDHWLIGAGAIGFEEADLTNPTEEKP